ncbi:hypothetical protein WNY78_15570 [Psychroserpens sp. AS72]|uniref:hypothetical protein n=1 Tax=Psychroserpens sp. AS72 TaxID=3135775 RepID=UPI003181F504
MKKIEIMKLATNGFNLEELGYEKTEEIVYDIEISDFERHFNKFTKEVEDKYKSKSFEENKVCLKQTIASIKHPFQFKTEWDWIKIKLPFNGWIKDKVRPRLYRRDVKYVIFAEICYPTDIIIDHIAKCAKQGALAASTVALTGVLTATQIAFQTAFFACMAAADFPNSDKISVRIAGDKIHGKWIPV